MRLESLPHESLPEGGSGHGGGNFVVSQIRATILPPEGNQLSGRYIRIELPGQQKILSLAEVEVFSGSENIARSGEATQSSVAYDGNPQLAIDGNTNGHYFDAKSTTHTEVSENPWWELDLKSSQPLDRIAIWSRNLFHG